MAGGNVTMQFDADTAKLIDSFMKVKDKTAELDRQAERFNAKQAANAEKRKKNAKTHLDQMGGLVKSYISFQGAVSGLTQLYHKLNQEMERAAENAKGTDQGMGSLAQLAKSPEELRRMVGQAQLSMKETGMSREQAGSLQFALQSAGLQKDRAKFARLHGMADPLQMLEAITTMQGAIGKEETGGAGQLADKIFNSSKATKTNAQQLAMAAAAAGGEARLVGTSDEELLAAIAVGARGTLDASVASTQVGALSAAASKSTQLKTGGGIMDIVSQIEAMGLDEGGLYELLGRKEAVKGFLTLSRGKQDITALTQENIAVDQAAASGRGDLTGSLARNYETVFAEQRAARIQGARASLSEEEAIGGEALERQAGARFLNQRLRESGMGVVRRTLNEFGYSVLTTFGADASAAIDATAPGDDTAGRDFALQMAGLRAGLEDLNKTLKEDRQASRTDARK